MTAIRPQPGLFGTVDPAPPALDQDVGVLRDQILNLSNPLFDRFRAIFGLRNLRTDEAALVLGQALRRDPSALLRHECAYVLGQMQLETAVPDLIRALREDANPMVRHESAESLGAIGGPEAEAALRRALVEDRAVEVRESCDLALQHIRYLSDPDQF